MTGAEQDSWFSSPLPFRSLLVPRLPVVRQGHMIVLKGNDSVPTSKEKPWGARFSWPLWWLWRRVQEILTTWITEPPAMPRASQRITSLEVLAGGGGQGAGGGGHAQELTYCELSDWVCARGGRGGSSCYHSITKPIQSNSTSLFKHKPKKDVKGK